MTDVDQFEFQAKYLRYLATQQRVSDWVKGPGSQKSRTRLGRKPSGPRRRNTKLSPASSDSSTTKDAEFTMLTADECQQETQQSQIISPTVALISSALFICAILPSLFTVSAFVVLLTYAGSLQVHVRLAVLPYRVFLTLFTIGVTKRKHH